jgi:AcrR family transcriptional regulator
MAGLSRHFYYKIVGAKVRGTFFNNMVWRFDTFFKLGTIEKYMEKNKAKQLTRDDWLNEALHMCVQGIDKVRVAPLAKSMGVTTGSFYWHFRNRRELLDGLLDYWEREMTDAAIVQARQSEVAPADRILQLMQAVMDGNMARYDLAFWAWAQSDEKVRRRFNRVLKKRFDFAAWMFEQAEFSPEQAKIRSRLMVTYMMGESTLVQGKDARSRKAIRQKHTILMAPAS